MSFSRVPGAASAAVSNTTIVCSGPGWAERTITHVLWTPRSSLA